MADQPKSLDFIHHVGKPLARIQDGFNTYQEACFTARPPEFFALELNGEAGELANNEKKAWKGSEVPFEKFEDEAADVFIALMNYCNARGVNLGRAVEKKVLIIEERRRGGRTHQSPPSPAPPETR